MDSRKRSRSDENQPFASTPCSVRHGDRKPAWQRLMLALVLAVLAGCASLPTDYPRSSSTAMQDHESTPIGRRVAEIAAQHPGNSAFQIIRYGRPAFTARVALADAAQRTLDVQYFLWETDATGRNLVDHLVRAADRSVRVRILIDDFNLKDLDATVAALDAHPNIEVRLFNPFALRGSHLIGFLTDFERVNHRMHNKLMVMDNAMAIVGGRNMSDPYFEVHPEFNFRDLDIAAAGPVVRELSSVFDRFWNGPWSVPIAALVDRPYTEADLREALKRLRENIAREPYPHPLSEDVAKLRAQLNDIVVGGIWARGQVVWDDPASINDPSLRTMRRLLVNRLERLERELLVESAYFIPLEPGVEFLKGLVSRGVRIRVLTNSLASNDVLAAFAGYSKVRDRLIASGVELYEVRPQPGPFPQEIVSSGSRAGLHTKAMVFDRKDVFVGSFNLDPRSSLINTEAGLYVESPELAAMVAQFMDEGVAPDRSYRVQLDERGNMYWVTEDGGKPLRYDVDPLSTFWQRWNAGFIRLLPVENQL
jgi:putative cardiolipin synthase